MNRRWPRPAGPRAARARRLLRWPLAEPGGLVAWYAIFAGYAGLVAIFSGGGADGIWGLWAAGGYAAAAILAWRTRRPAVPLCTALACALAAPMVWLAVRDPATADVSVVTRSAMLLLRTGSPYLPVGQLATWRSYNPYLPVMAVFGLPRAVGLPGLIGDPRPWLAVTSAVLLAGAFWLNGAYHGAVRRLGRRGAANSSAANSSAANSSAANSSAANSSAANSSAAATAALSAVFAVGSPVLAFPLAVGITDPPVIALICFAFACLTRCRVIRSRWLPVLAALAIGAACAMKATAWPALAVIAALLAARDGTRAAARFVVATAATAAGLIAATAPGLLAKPAALLQNTVLYPLGMTLHKTPAASPLPGHALAVTGQAGHLAAIGLLLAAGLAVAASLVLRPPADVPAAARRLAIGLALMFLLAPATRFGYFAYPAALLGWSAVASREPVTPGDGLGEDDLDAVLAITSSREVQ